jgi:ketosteroid isomerase-like protein
LTPLLTARQEETLMLRLLLVLVIAPLCALNSFAQTAPDASELTKLLNDFLAGAGRNDVAMHDRFWAEDLIYTGATGRRVGKADIMKDLRSSPTVRSEQRTTYSAEDVRIQQYGPTAIVAFRLVAKVERGNSTDVTRYFNTGTFLKRDGKWQVVSWQATRLPRTEAETRNELAAIEESFNKATLAADINTLEQILDESFIWTQRAGEQVTGQQFIENLRTGQLKYSQLDNRNVNISLAGDAAIIRGVTVRRRSEVPGSAGADAEPYTAFYTLTFVNKGGAWKAVALHTSRQ